MGQALVTYLWQDDVPAAIVLGPNAPGNPSGQDKLLYLEVDHLNTPRVARDEQKRVVWRWDSDAFGNTAPNEDPDGDGIKTTINLRFAGQYFDAESGLHYNWHRYYDPQTGRYTQPDPIGVEGGLNPYAYVDGNPITGFDPEGLVNGSSAQMWMNSRGMHICAWRQCLANDPLFSYVAPFSLLPAVNLKTPGDLRLPGSSPWTSVDRRFPGLPGANPNGGAVARVSGTVQRIKFAGTYGTAAVAIGTFATTYSATAMARCACEAGE